MKSYIVDRSSSTPKLNEMPTNVEKIYQTKEAAEAALANGDIVDGEFVSTVDTVETDIASKDYIRKQNRLGDIEEITISSSSSTPTVMLYDGIIYTEKRTDTASTITVNSITLFTTSGTNYTSLQSFEVNKGDEVVVTGQSTVPIKARFYKLRDYSDRG